MAFLLAREMREIIARKNDQREPELDYESSTPLFCISLPCSYSFANSLFHG
jgi:hypothetical protein